MSSAYTERQRIEKEWHDEKFREGVGPGGARRIDRTSQRFWEIVGEPRGLTILDFGCGDGWVSVRLAKLGNRLHGFDISASLIERAKGLAERANVAGITSFKEMAAENLDYPDESFDMIVGTSILHHTDLDKALERIRAVLKADGTAIFMEPLNQNILLKTWRALTPWRRTETERAFSSDDVALVRRLFPSTRFTYFSFLSMFTTSLLFLAPQSRFLNAANERFESLDERLLSAFPALGKYSAVAIMEMRK